MWVQGPRFQAPPSTLILLLQVFVLALSAVPAMAAATKPTIVIFRSVLARAGYESHHVALPSVGGTELPLTGLAEDVAAVRDVVAPLADRGDDIVLLCHSSGGVVGSNAIEGYDIAARSAEGKVGGVIRIVYLSAFVLPKGQSPLNIMGGDLLQWMEQQGDRVTGDPNLMPVVGFNDLPADKQAFWAQQVTWTSVALFAAPSQFQPWTNGIPGAYIFERLDNALPYELQQDMAEQLQIGPDPRTATIESGHCGFLSMPERLLGALKQVTKEN
ncbi:Alpha/beta hydrolase family-domain-containing protein [Corynascus novoguineensis]|uniref:Alpha/beta hydrolase family-domain-containing protein n=1 Tax=Corynascus novoguineensis TaxID=1126955 RepID=A0AAN7HL42_9PEZI|nr:Alpha/beta hydrolase family-domain-containing protein [Corynascus novoguineensis]